MYFAFAGRHNRIEKQSDRLDICWRQCCITKWSLSNLKLLWFTVSEKQLQQHQHRRRIYAAINAETITSLLICSHTNDEHVLCGLQGGQKSKPFYCYHTFV